MDDEIEEPTDGSFTTRFSASRLRQVAEKHLNDDKRGILNDCNFVSLMNISPFYVPYELLDRVVMKIDPKQGLLRYKNYPHRSFFGFLVFFVAMFSFLNNMCLSAFSVIKRKIYLYLRRRGTTKLRPSRGLGFFYASRLC